jgi:hypothetical protein
MRNPIPIFYFKKRKITKKIISIVLTVVLIITSIPPRKAEASWFSDFCGFIFTVGTIPIWVLCPDNPTFRKNNPFRQKVWEEEAEEQKRFNKRLSTHRKVWEEDEKRREERFKKYQTDLSSAIAAIVSLQNENKELRSMVASKLNDEDLLKIVESINSFVHIVSKLNDETLLEIATNVINNNKHLLKGVKGDIGAAGQDGKSFTLDEFVDAYECNPAFRDWIDGITDERIDNRIKLIRGGNQTITDKFARL